jgi:Uncharacterized protein related to plant photosystem II stability/assembly factor
LSLSACLVICVAFTAQTTVAQSNWSSVRSGAGGDLVAVYFTSDKNGWIAGDAGYLAFTNDGGASWSKYPLDTHEDINEIYFRNDNNGYLVAGRVMYITHDGGKTGGRLVCTTPPISKKARLNFSAFAFREKRSDLLSARSLKR